MDQVIFLARQIFECESFILPKDIKVNAVRCGGRRSIDKKIQSSHNICQLTVFSPYQFVIMTLPAKTNSAIRRKVLPAKTNSVIRRKLSRKQALELPKGLSP